MPPPSSLRAGLPLLSSSNTFVNSSQLNEPYSDEDIELIHAIVALAEHIYPSLPERERLPTNALFHAAEQILPEHGYDPDDAPSHISRLIFKIGGQRSGETLSDKFRTVLEGMGIKLEFVPSSPPIVASDDEEGTTTTVDINDVIRQRFLGNPQRQRRWRHSSVSRRSGDDRLSMSDEGTTGTYELPTRARSRPRSRSVSFLDDRENPVRRGEDVDDESTRPFSRLGRDGEAIQFVPAARTALKTKGPTVVEEEKRRPVTKDRRIGNWQDNHQDEEVDDLDDNAMPNQQLQWAQQPHSGGKASGNGGVPHIPEHFRAHIPIRQKINNRPGRGLEHAISAPAENGIVRDKEQLSLLPRSASASTVADTEPAPHSPRSDEDDGLHGAPGNSDTTVQTQEGDPHPSRPHLLPPLTRIPPHGGRPAVDFAALEAKLQQLRMNEEELLCNDVLDAWRVRRAEAQDSRELAWSSAIDWDDRDIFEEVLEVWHENTLALRDERAQAEASLLEEEAERVRQAEITRMENRATRCYEIFLIRNTLAHWQDSALEEVDRTAVARRYLVRKKAFEAWRAQHVQDESKVTNFILMEMLQRWGQVSLHLEVRRRVAVQHDEQNLLAPVLETILTAHKKNLADRFWEYRAAWQYLDAWLVRANQAMDEHEMAIDVDDRLVLDEAANIWHDELEELRYHAADATVRYSRQEAIRVLGHWQEQTRLERLLAWYRAADEEDTIHTVLDLWRAASTDSRLNRERAVAFAIDDYLTQWHNETKVKLFTQRDEDYTKFDVLSHWYYSERLAWWQRDFETQLMRSTLNQMLDVAQQARAHRVREEREAYSLEVYNLLGDAVDHWLMVLDKGAAWRHRRNADVVNLYYTNRPVVDYWWAAAQESIRLSTQFRRQAAITSNRHIAINVLEEWPEAAETARRERLLQLLRLYRRNYKISLATDCLDHWHELTADAWVSGRRAHDAYMNFRSDDINSYLDYWLTTTHTAEDFMQIAADAEVEVFCGKWQAIAREMRDDHDYAIYTAEDKELARCLETWEFEALQIRSREQMVGTVRGRNDQRLIGQMLDEWHQFAIPESAANATQLDPRMSTLEARRSIRQQLSRSTAAATPGPSFGRGNGNGATTGRTRPPFFASTLPVRPNPNVSFQPQPQTPHFPFRESRPVSPETGNGDGEEGNLQSLLQAGRYGLDFDEDSLLPETETNDPGFMSTPTRWTGSARPLGYRPSTTPSAILPSPYERELRNNGYGFGSASTSGSGRGGRGLSLLRDLGRGNGFSASTPGTSSRLGGRGAFMTPGNLRGNGATPGGRGATTGGRGQRERVVEFADITEASAEDA
ncbi:Sfi1 spindle body protein-domain-containing protein [Podospora australis]|uniref:Sfi1 spindle body protein-domain-containing protein n=1 Tax=Podospora australis TaxID=1536484 RepID=A0AAN6WT17_9PEZI|nr:Sfi1 spindle body protein-domain-containing protein [Podospora australis]